MSYRDYIPSNREALRHAPAQPAVKSKPPDITRSRPKVVVRKAPLTQAAGPKFVPDEKPVGTVAINVPVEQGPRHNIGAAPIDIDLKFLCPACGQRRTADGCLCKLLIQPDDR